MLNLNRTALPSQDESTCGQHEAALNASATPKEPKTGFSGFLISLMEAHRYVHNRRTAAPPN